VSIKDVYVYVGDTYSDMDEVGIKYNAKGREHTFNLYHSWRLHKLTRNTRARYISTWSESPGHRYDRYRLEVCEIQVYGECLPRK